MAFVTHATGIAGLAPVPVQAPQDYVDRGEAAFADGRLEDAVAAFDRVALLDPEAAPWLWQRGIARYYLGQYEACADQFAAYKRANPADLESAVWHAACVARLRSLEVAESTMLPPGRDNRVMRAEVYEMFAGRLSPAAVVGRAHLIGDVALFHAHFYVGLYAEVAGDREAAAEHLRTAASERFADLTGFMNVVARHHWLQISGRGAIAGDTTATDATGRRIE